MKKEKHTMKLSKMSEFELSKWLGLMIAMDKIYDTSLQYKVDFETLELKPLEIRKYIDFVSSKIEHDLKRKADFFVET